MGTAQIRNLVLIGIALALLLSSRTLANFTIEYQWWQEVGQIDTWLRMLLYQVLPAAVTSIIAWAVLLWAHRRGAHFSGADTRVFPWYGRLVPVVLLLFAVLFLGTSIDAETVMAYVGSAGIEAGAGGWVDPVFSRPLNFYLFGLPFYSLLLRFVFLLAFFSIVVFWATGRGWQLYDRIDQFRRGGGSMEQFDPGPNPLLLAGATKTSFARIIAVLALLALAVWFYLGRYGLLLNTHAFMTGMDWLDENVTLPLRWIVILAFLGAVPLVMAARWKFAVGLVAVSLGANLVIPQIVRAAYVRPNELTLEVPYIERHLQATTAAFGLQHHGQTQTFNANRSEEIDVNEHATLIDNIRLWDWRAFKDTVTQIQALRPYYRFADVDIDRYIIDGKIKQVLLSPRELDVTQLPAEARASWINEHFVYTHGYGVVMAEVNRTTEDGLPVLLIQDAPPQIRTADVELSRPELYYGEVTHDPVFVNTDQKEFDYPAGDQNITSNYQGTGGFSISSFAMKLAAAVSQTEYNILLTGQTNDNSRMMLYRDVHARMDHLAPFIHWETDPYLVIAEDGRLVWIVDGYTSSDAHPYSAALSVEGFGGRTNYVRNAVKATIDAYHGATNIYVFEPDDPILQAYRGLFPSLFHDESEMPPSLRRHTRYPELMFQIQAEIYRTFHMKDPEVFYNKEDVWDIAQSLSGDTGSAAPMRPTYIVTTIPGNDEPEFLLMLPFTPRGKDNLIGWMAARCDGDKLGELIFFQLSKQELVFGPNQIESRINQDQNIARDLTLWNQQGSRVLRGEMIALPVADNFLYVESIYIQAESARMPQLKKVVLALGNRLIYEDTFERALDRLSAGQISRPPPVELTQAQPGGEPPPTATAEADAAARQRMRALAQRLTQLRQQAQTLVDEIGQVERDLQR